MKDVTAIKRRKNGAWVNETASYIRTGGAWKPRRGVYAGGEWYVPGSKYSYIKLVVGEKSVNLPLEYGFIKETGNRLYIDWGDGSSEETTLVGELAIAHTYTRQGEYVIKTHVDSGTYQINFIGIDIYYTSRPSNGSVPDYFIGTTYYDIREVLLGLGVNKIPDYGFGNLSNLHKVNMFDVEVIGIYCFAKTNLTEINFGNKLRIIEDTGLDMDSRFARMILPATIEFVNISCGIDDELIIYAPVPPGTFYIGPAPKTIKVPAGSIDAYKNRFPNWANKITAI